MVIKMNIEKIKSFITGMIYPADIYCISCGRPISPGHLYSLCEECLNDIVWADKKTCMVCGKPLESWYPEDRCSQCLNTEHYFERGVTCFLYKDGTRDMIKDLKYHGKSYLARIFGKILADRIIYEGMKFDLCTAVPMYAGKERSRGYNQAALIARFMAASLDVPYVENLLVRTRDTVPMNTLTAADRRKNLRGAFELPDENRALVRDRTVMLVDDIYTTGSTMDACSRELLEGGAGRVYISTLASGRNQRDLSQDHRNHAERY